MRCSCAKTGLLVDPHLRTRRRGPVQTLKIRDLTHPGKIKRCVRDVPHLLFGRFPCTAVIQNRPGLRLPADYEPTPQNSITGFDALLSNESYPGELDSFTWLAGPES